MMNRIEQSLNFIQLMNMRYKYYRSNQSLLIYKVKYRVRMVSTKFQSQQSSQHSDPQHQHFKQISFQLLHCLQRSNENIHDFIYYILMLIESLQVFYYITHPALPFYQNSNIMNTIHEFLQYLVFNEFVVDYPNMYQIAIPLCVAYVAVLLGLVLLIVSDIKDKKLINDVNRIHIVANVMFVVLNTILTIPFFGLAYSVLYCDTQSNRYTLGHNCYQGQQIGYCFLAAFIILVLTLGQGINWYIYFNKNPFAGDFLAKYQNNAVIGKFVIKIITMIYLSVDLNSTYSDVYVFGIAASFGGYVFFFRLFSFHDYNQRNFYVVLFMEVILAWFTVNNIILSYLDTERKAGGLFQSFLCSLLVAALVLQFQEENYKKIFMEGMESQKVKKQNIQKFLYRLIYMFTHSQTDDQKNHISTIIKILSSKLKDLSHDVAISNVKMTKRMQRKFYFFLSKFVLENLELNWNPMLMAIYCNLLMMEEKFSYAFHQSLELSNKKISIAEELMMYRFRRHQRYDKEKLDTSKKQNNNIFMMYYDFNQNLMRLDEEIATCTFNNLDFWQEVCEASPSIYKIRNLAEKYEHHQELIDKFYNKIYEIFPNNKLAIRSYIEFLMYIGVSVGNLTKAKERYKQAQENIKKTKELQRDTGNLIEMGQNQNLAFVSIETSEVSLSTITNCNIEFKKMLGYEKGELIDKKVNKIMPKAFSEFHDNLVKKYIQKKEHNEKNKVQRVVYALSKQNFLVEVVLFTKVNFKTIGEKASLELVGFLKKIQDPNKAVIILEMQTQNIVGANRGFSTLIQNGITSSQFSNSQIKIFTLLPDLDVSLVEESKQQETNLIFSSSVIVTKSGLNLQVKKKVCIEVEQIRVYATSKQKFAYLILRELAGSEDDIRHSGPLSNDRSDRSMKIQKEDKKVKRKKVIASQVSIMQQQFNPDMMSSMDMDSDIMKRMQFDQDKDSQLFLMIERKKQQFLKKQHLQVFIYILWIGLFLFISITIGLLIYSILITLDMLNTSTDIKDQVRNSYDITYQTALICRDVEKIMQGNKYNQSQFNNNSAKLKASIQVFQQNLIPLMTESTKWNFPLQLNTPRYYEVVIDNQNGVIQYAEQTIVDAFFQLISSAKNYVAYVWANITSTTIAELEEENIFIQLNGKELFPKIAQKMSLEYLNLDSYMFDQSITNKFIVMMSYTANLLLALLFIALLIKKINAFNQSVVLLYNQIRLWDATEMRGKCLRFIQKNSTGVMKSINSKRKLTSLLNVFPQETFIQVIASISKNEAKQHLKNMSTSNQEDHLLHLQTTSEVEEIKNEGELSRMTDKQRRFYVNLQQKNKVRGKFIVLIIIALIFIGAFFIEHYLTNNYESKILYYNTRISQLGKVRKNLAFINYYTYELMLNSSQQSYRSLLQNEITQFYSNTDVCYDIIGDPSTILKATYNLVEMTSVLIFSNSLNVSNTTRYSISNPQYLLQESIFQQNIQEITNLIYGTIDDLTGSLFSSIETIKIVFVIIYLFFNIFLVITIKCWLLSEIIRNSRKSKSMVVMLPPWLIDRNKGISETLK